jgi:ABC-type glycerol-3-phosphate transport system substrate-binding protein
MDKTKVVMAAGSGLPDIFQSWGGSTMGGYADLGRLLDLTKELKGIPGSAAAQNAMTWKGKIYGVAPFFAICGVFYNQGIFKANNLTVPTTIADMEKVADALKAKGIQPFACGAKDKWPPLHLYMYFVDRFGGISAFTDAAARKAPFNGDAFVKAAQKYQEWIKKGYFGDKPLGEAYGDAQQLMATGKAAMHITGTWMCAQYADPKFTDQTIGFYAFPDMAGGVGKMSDMMGMTDIGFAATTVAASKKAAVVKFMKYAMSKEACSAEMGRLCSVPGVKAPTKLTEMAAGVFGKAKAVQFWWDQDLPPALGGPANDTVGMFFLPDTDVSKALADFEQKVVDVSGPVK